MHSDARQAEVGTTTPARRITPSPTVRSGSRHRVDGPIHASEVHTPEILPDESEGEELRFDRMALEKWLEEKQQALEDEDW